MKTRSLSLVVLAGLAAALLATAPVGAADAAPERSALAAQDGPGWVDLRSAGTSAVPQGERVPWSSTPVAPVSAPAESVPAEVAGPEGLTGGNLDTTFSSDGIATPNFVSGYEDATAVVVQPDGKLVVGGGASIPNQRFQLARLNADGLPDSSFSGDGAVQTDLTDGPDWVEDLALQSDGKLVAVGTAAGVSAVVRYKANGSIDTGFGTQGGVGLLVGRGFNFASSVAIDGNGRIVFAGRAGGQGGRFFVARTNANGTPDTTFSGDGVAILDFSSHDDWAWDLDVLADNRIVVAGATEGSQFSMALARFNANGTLDTSFSGDGKRKLSLDANAEAATTVLARDDGTTLVAGSAGALGGQMAIARLDVGGVLDTGFGGDGWSTVNFSAGDDFAWRIVEQGDGAIVLAGYASGLGGRIAVAHLDAVGAPDPTFSGDGKLTTNVTTGVDVAHSVALDGDGNIVVAGVSDGARTSARLVVARYLAA